MFEAHHHLSVFVLRLACCPSLLQSPRLPQLGGRCQSVILLLSSIAGQCRNFVLIGVIAVFGGAVPMLFVAYTTAPLVFYIHLRLPLFARRSRDALMRYSKNLPANARIELTTMKFSSRRRVTSVRVSELKPMRAWLSVANLVRKPPSSTFVPSRAWWMGKPPRKFYVGTERGRSREKGVWANILSHIKQSS